MAKRRDPLVWGTVLIALGLIFILENFGIDVWDSVWKLWPVVLIIWGGAKLLDGLKARSERLDSPKPPAPQA